MFKTSVQRVCVGVLMIAWFNGGVLATTADKGVCDIRVGSRMSVYQVLVGDEVYRGKGYLTYQDALSLRDVLLSGGTCKQLAAPKACEIQTLSAFNFAIFRDGVNFDRYAKLRTLEQARAYARALVKKKLCVMNDAQ